MAKVVAVKRGYDGVTIREVGDVFDYAGKVEAGSWMKPVEPEKHQPKKEAPKHHKAEKASDLDVI